MRRRSQWGLGLIEALMSLLLIGVILGIVGRGYQAMNRMNLATYQMSQRMELGAFLTRLSNEVSSALSVNLIADGFSFRRIDPTLNLEYYEPALRLPWEPVNGIPPGITTANPMSPTYQITVTYRLNTTQKRIERTAYSVTSIETVDVGEFLVGKESGGRVLSVSLRPKEMTGAVKARIFMPVVTP